MKRRTFHATHLFGQLTYSNKIAHKWLVKVFIKCRRVECEVLSIQGNDPPPQRSEMASLHNQGKTVHELLGFQDLELSLTREIRPGCLFPKQPFFLKDILWKNSKTSSICVTLIHNSNVPMVAAKFLLATAGSRQQWCWETVHFRHAPKWLVSRYCLRSNAMDPSQWRSHPSQGLGAKDKIMELDGTHFCM